MGVLSSSLYSVIAMSRGGCANGHPRRLVVCRATGAGYSRAGEGNAAITNDCRAGDRESPGREEVMRGAVKRIEFDDTSHCRTMNRIRT